MKQLLVLTSVLLVLVAGCGGSTTSVEQNNLQPIPPVTAVPQESALLSGQALHNASGVPTGIRLSWTAVNDAADAGSRIDGYHIYRADSPIADGAVGDGSLWVSIEGNTLVNQAVIPGSEIVVEDLFAVSVGETWYYRLSSVARDGDESALSPELAFTIAPFFVDLLVTTSAAVGGPVVIQGRNFGVSDAVNDKVEFSGVVWEDGVGFTPAWVEATITSWTPTLITATVPLGATVGKVQVTIGGIAVTTPEDFQNTDPYITDVDRLSASFQNPVTLTGNNFGANYDPTHRVVYNGAEILSDTSYSAYSNTTITFKPLNLQDYAQHPVTVAVAAVNSNVAFNILENALPEAVLNAIPVTGIAPLALRFNASGSLDPENDGNPNNGITNYEWDFDGDGVFSEADNGEAAASGRSSPQFTYATPGVYNPAVRVYDVELGTGTATIAVDVTTPPAPTIFDDPLQTDPHENINPFTAPDYVVKLFYGVQDGLGPYSVDVDADYAEVVPGDALASFGLNDPLQVFDTAISPFPTASPNIQDSVQVTQNVPGNYALALRVTDTLGRQVVHVYPGVVAYIPPSKIAVIEDKEGDPNSGGPTVSDNILGWLIGLGYPSQLFSSEGLVLGDLDGFDACIWASNGPRGTDVDPFQWLSSTDLRVIKQFEDTGRSVIIISPPFGNGGADLFQDALFNSDYQPFQGVRKINTGANSLLVPLDFTATGPPDIISFESLGTYVDTNQTPLYPGCTREVESIDTGQLEPVAAIRPGPAGGNLYFALFSIPDIVAIDPAGLGTEVLIDNIVSGTIALQ